jgi:hypothetical protein
MHVHKSGGTSIRASLERTLQPGSLAPRRMEPGAALGSFTDLDALGPEPRARLVVTDEERAELARHHAVAGHFSLPTLSALAPPERIGTVLREPRARVVSHYLYLRFKVALRTLWHPYDAAAAAEGTLVEFLSDRRTAALTDNLTCRLLLRGDPRIDDDEFIAERDLDAIAGAAWERLSELGMVRVLEVPEDVWAGIGELFGIEVEPARANVTGGDGIWPGTLPVPPFGGGEALALLERRSAADAVLYRRTVERLYGAEAVDRLADAAFAEQLVVFGSYTAREDAIDEAGRQASLDLRDALYSRTVERDRHAELLSTITASRSWRLTAPLRRTVLRARRARG